MIERGKFRSLTLVNWNGFFARTFDLDDLVTTLSGGNGAGKSTTMAAFPEPNASPPHPAPRSLANLREPSVSSDLMKLSASTFWVESAVALPSVTSCPPAAAMKAPMRWYSLLMVSPTTSPLVARLAAAASWSHVLGISASVKPAASHRSVLIRRARVEASFASPYR